MTTAPRSGGDTGESVLADLVAGVPVVLLVAAATWRLLDFPATYLAQTLALYAAAAVLIHGTLPRGLPGPGVGAANRVTLGRLAIILPVAALTFAGRDLGVPGRWWVIVLSTIVLVLDGVDGRVARRTRTESAFGARLDMETDAFLLLVLSFVVWTEGRAGAWVLLVGGLRYLFVVAGWMVPALREELFSSLRRKIVCVVQGIALLVSLGPIVPDGAASWVAAISLLLLVGSFGIDTVWLMKNPGATVPSPMRGR